MLFARLLQHLRADVERRLEALPPDERQRIVEASITWRGTARYVLEVQGPYIAFGAVIGVLIGLAWGLLR